MKNKKDRNGKKSGKKSLIPSFLSKLYQILEVKLFIFMIVEFRISSYYKLV